MRPLELTLTAILLLSPLAYIWASGRVVALSACLIAVLALAVHLFAEGPRLQAAPLYLAVPVLLVLTWWPAVPKPLFRIPLSFMVACLALVGGLACYAFPVLQFPKPTGPYAIGTSTFYFADTSRREKYAPIGGNRRVVAQIWYPAVSSNAKAAPYRDARSLIWKSAHLRYVETHAYREAAPLSGTRWPVIFFSPSSGGYRSQNTFLVEHLVSHGYIVVGIDHPDTCSRVVFPDGVLIHSLPDVWLDLRSQSTFLKSTAKTEDILQTNLQDVEFVFDRFENSTPDARLSLIADRMDLSRSAVMGHSFGGALASEICRVDPRFRAGVNMDGYTFSGVNENGVPRPFLFLFAGNAFWVADNGPYPDTPEGIEREIDKIGSDAIYHSVSRWGSCAVRLLNANHSSFSDIALFQRPVWRQTDQEIRPQTAHEVINSLVLAFLDEHLKEGRGEFKSAVSKNIAYLQATCGPSPYFIQDATTSKIKEVNVDDIH